MVVIRLARGGAKKHPFYHIVVTDSRNARDGRYIERIGYFNPVARGQEIRFRINEERFNHWSSTGAQASHRVSHLVKELDKGGQIVDNAKVLVARKHTKVTAVSPADEQPTDNAVSADDTVTEE
jgi:small subunit ribosomal protein S16